MPVPDAIVLAGGLGTRLRSVVTDRPKVLAEVRGRPFVVYLLDALAQAGVQRAVLCTGFMAEAVEATLGRRHSGVELVYSREEQPLGTGGAVRLALPLVRTATALVLNGDSYCGLDWAALLAADAAADWLTVVRVEDTGRYGRVEFEPGSGRVTQFVEKAASSGPGWINAGVYRLSQARLATLPAGRAVSLEKECFPRWCGELRAFAAAGPFLDIGTPESFRQAEAFFAPPPVRDRS